MRVKKQSQNSTHKNLMYFTAVTRTLSNFLLIAVKNASGETYKPTLLNL